ncbi:MAG TPA: serine/threonine-protein kinase [Candidatus Krumholzibacteria bacterium]|nr:serine/threonine-protein kinase [Candidatus Krumholzibacteria bacterium]
MQAVFRIRGYDSFEQIAVGGMAVVYKARKQSIKKTVAIKVLLPHLAADPLFITRFQQEAEAAARIQHDNIVNVIDYGKFESSYYIVMEYYDGLTIEELLRTQPRLPIDISLSVMLNVAYGLEAAHGENLVHRDIKPANVIFTRQGGIKIADFGLAKAVDKFNFVTHHGKVVGTPAYMSPEQTRGELVGTQSDIFSLGVVAYELLAGRRPFEGAGYAEVVEQIQNREPPAISSFNPMVEAPFQQIVTRMLRKSVDERYRHVAEVVMELEQLMDRHGFRRDRRSLGEFFSDPVGYTEAAAQVVLERLTGEAPASAPQNREREAAINHYRKILYLDPGDEGARASLKRLGVQDAAPAIGPGAMPRLAGPAPRPKTDGEYRVVLSSIDLTVETTETFALKLSMRLKSPLPRMRSLIAHTPCTVAQRLPYRKAKWLESILKELGGQVRLEEFVEPKPAEKSKEPGDVKQEAINKHVRPERLTSSGGILCSHCGWEEEADAKFCSLCRRRFNKTDKIDVRALEILDNPDENPLSLPDATPANLREAAKWFKSVPPMVMIGASAALLLIVIIIAIVAR